MRSNSSTMPASNSEVLFLWACRVFAVCVATHSKDFLLIIFRHGVDHRLQDLPHRDKRPLISLISPPMVVKTAFYG